MKRRDCLTLALAPLSLPAVHAQAGEPALLDGLRQRLRQPEWLRGEFEQSKLVQGFKKPLLSRGDFVVARGRGVLWRTRQPFASELRLTREQIRASQGSAPALQLDAQREPALRLVNEMMFALLGGDVAALSQLFVLEGELLGRSSWRLQLRPRQAAWLQVLQRIALSGDGHVREVEILEASGDLTRIRFQQLREGDAEPRLFD